MQYDRQGSKPVLKLRVKKWLVHLEDRCPCPPKVYISLHTLAYPVMWTNFLRQTPANISEYLMSVQALQMADQRLKEIKVITAGMKREKYWLEMVEKYQTKLSRIYKWFKSEILALC